MSESSFSGTVTMSIGQMNANQRTKQYDGLPDTPVEDIKWHPMDAFLEYRENTEFSARGKTWFASSGSLKEGEGKWSYWAVASPYIGGDCNSWIAREHDVRVRGYATREESQAALIEAVRKA
jgi:hypothetical protein